MRWAKKFAVGAIFCATLIACSQVPEIERSKIEPPSTELRKRLSHIVVRVYSETKPSWHASEEAIVGAGAGASYAAGKGVKAGYAGVGPAALGCDPGWREFWLLTCPAGIVVGIGTAVAGAVVGSAGGAVYGAIAADSPEEMKAAIANLDKALLKTKIEDALHDRLVRSIQQNTSSKIVEDEATEGTFEQPSPGGKEAIIVAIQIDDFSLAQKGRLSPDLLLSFRVSGGLYAAPKDDFLHERGWALNTKLGNFVGLLEENESGLQRKLGEVFEKMATAIVDDIFLTFESRPIVADPASDAVDPVLASYSSIPSISIGENDTRTPKAACGDAEAQLELGKAYASVDARIYGWRARQNWVEAYKWLKLAQDAGNQEAESAIGELEPKLTPDEIASAERLVFDFQPRECPKELVEQSRPANVVSPESAVAATQSSDEPSALSIEEITSKETKEVASAAPLPPGSTIDFDQDRAAIKEAISNYYFKGGYSNDIPGNEHDSFYGLEMDRIRSVTVQKLLGNQIDVSAEYTASSNVSVGSIGLKRKSRFLLRKENGSFTVIKMWDAKEV